MLALVVAGILTKSLISIGCCNTVYRCFCNGSFHAEFDRSSVLPLLEEIATTISCSTEALRGAVSIGLFHLVGSLLRDRGSVLVVDVVEG